jgi:chemotaxis protein CheZ
LSRGDDLMEEKLKKEILGILNGKLSAGEIDRLIRFMDRNDLPNPQEGTNGFFKHLAREMGQEMKALAELIVEFKKDCVAKVHPGISEVRAKYLPQAADQLEGIIESTEIAANRIMDNLEMMQRHMEEAKAILSGSKQEPVDAPRSAKAACRRIEDCLALVGDSFEQMSFQDLTGQRIKRTIDLVNLMDERLQKTLLSFGIKIAEKNRNPGISGKELEKAVERGLSELRGSQGHGEGLNQADIDKLLARM